MCCLLWPLCVCCGGKIGALLCAGPAVQFDAAGADSRSCTVDPHTMRRCRCGGRGHGARLRRPRQCVAVPLSSPQLCVVRPPCVCRWGEQTGAPLDSHRDPRTKGEPRPPRPLLSRRFGATQTEQQHSHSRRRQRPTDRHANEGAGCSPISTGGQETRHTVCVSIDGASTGTHRRRFLLRFRCVCAACRLAWRKQCGAILAGNSHRSAH